MKRKVLVRLHEKAGDQSVRDVGPHEVFSDGTQSTPVPRHNEINELKAKGILKRAGIHPAQGRRR